MRRTHRDRQSPVLRDPSPEVIARHEKKLAERKAKRDQKLIERMNKLLGEDTMAPGIVLAAASRIRWQTLPGHGSSGSAVAVVAGTIDRRWDMLDDDVLNRALLLEIAADDGEFMPSHAEWNDTENLEAAGLTEEAYFFGGGGLTYKLTEKGHRWLGHNVVPFVGRKQKGRQATK
jgi:hypothetical protein